MGGLYRDQGVVLRAVKLGEADRILTILTAVHGKVRAVAKGVRRTKSRFGGRLEPFTVVDLMLYRGRGELDTVTSAAIAGVNRRVREDYAAYTAACALAETVDKVTEEREGQPAVYGLLVGALGALDDGAGPSVVPAFLVKLLAVTGYHPSLSSCAGCGATSGLRSFSPALGGAACRDCAREDPSAMAVGPGRIELIRSLLVSEYGLGAEPGALTDVTQALRRYAEYHLERPLRSLSLLAT